jgi:hypothetical protein
VDVRVRKPRPWRRSEGGGREEGEGKVSEGDARGAGWSLSTRGERRGAVPSEDREGGRGAARVLGRQRRVGEQEEGTSGRTGWAALQTRAQPLQAFAFYFIFCFCFSVFSFLFCLQKCLGHLWTFVKYKNWSINHSATLVTARNWFGVNIFLFGFYLI